MIILGLDPGTATTGFGVIDVSGGKLTHIAHGCISTEANTPLPERLHQIAVELRMLIAKYEPTQVGIEELFFSSNVKTAIAVAQARGVLLQVATEAGLTVRGFTPPQIKQALTSHGAADKKQMQKMICLILNLKETPKPDDAADALAIAVTCANTHSFRTMAL